MNENRFTSAGWASIAAAVLLPTSFIIAGIEDAAADYGLMGHRVGLGLADFLFLILGAVGIYVLLNLKKLMYERYSFRGLNVIIGIAILWTIINYGGSFVLELVFTFVPSSVADSAELISVSFWIICIAGFGIIDIIIGLIVFMQRHRFSTPLRVFAVTSLALGICEATVILSFFALILAPVSLIALAFEFLKSDDAVEFI
jgi:hypothetical protein